MYEIVSGLVNNYSQFFYIDNIVSTFSDPASWGIILSLMILEGLLSSDNALVLALLVRHLPEKQQPKALFYGIGGAYGFRFLAIGLGTYIIKIWWIKILGGLYLLYLVWQYFDGKYFNGNSKEETQGNALIRKGFWATVVTVEMMDITFSIDSVTAAFGVSEKVWVIFLGAVFGIAMMRCVAKTFVTLINKIPELETTAYILILIVGIRMIASTASFVVPDIWFFGLLIAVFLGTIIYHYQRKLSVKL